jgi:hypothetical protein
LRKNLRAQCKRAHEQYVNNQEIGKHKITLILKNSKKTYTTLNKLYKSNGELRFVEHKNKFPIMVSLQYI